MRRRRREICSPRETEIGPDAREPEETEMPARKNRPSKAGIGVLNSVEKMYLRYWFTEGRNKSVWVDPDDVVWGGHGFDTDRGSSKF